MKSRTIAILCAAVLVLSGCRSENITINGAGATFPYPIYAKWFDEYHKLHPEIQINYQSIGSGGGIRQLQAGTVDFGASDSPVTDEQMSKMPSEVLHFPTVLGAVVPTYNLPGVAHELNFTPQALAGIFLGDVQRWDDPVLALANTEVKLPAQQIVSVHRSDGSGTTFVWTDFLSKTSPAWTEKIGAGTSVRWPSGLGAKGNEGVSGLVKQTPYSIGYVELVYALQNKMAYGRVQNRAGRFVKATTSSVTAAADAAVGSIPNDFRVSITNASSDQAYPISSFTWLLLPRKIQDERKRRILAGFLGWMLNDGQKMAEQLGYAPLPGVLAARELESVRELR